jgi:hypothetical protein
VCLQLMNLIDRLFGVNVKKTLYIFIPLFCVIAYFSVALYSLTGSGIEDIIICSSDEGEAHYIPSVLCERYLLNYRATADDVQALESNAGLSFLFGIQGDSKRYLYLDYFLSKGVSINALSNVDGLTPLHAAIVLNDVELVKYLLNKGANPTQVDKNYALTPLELSQKLDKARDPIKRSAITDLIFAVAAKSE